MRTFSDQQRWDFQQHCQHIDAELAGKKAEEERDGPRNCRIGIELKRIKEDHLYELDGYTDPDGKDEAFFRWARDHRKLDRRQVQRYLKAAELAHLVKGRAPLQEQEAVHDSPEWMWGALVEAVHQGVSASKVVTGRRHGMLRNEEDGISEDEAAREAKDAALGLIEVKVVKHPEEEMDQVLRRAESDLILFRKLVAQYGPKLGQGLLHRVVDHASVLLEEVEPYLKDGHRGPPGPGPGTGTRSEEAGPRGPEAAPTAATATGATVEAVSVQAEEIKVQPVVMPAGGINLTSVIEVAREGGRSYHLLERCVYRVVAGLPADEVVPLLQEAGADLVRLGAPRGLVEQWAGLMGHGEWEQCGAFALWFAKKARLKDMNIFAEALAQVDLPAALREGVAALGPPPWAMTRARSAANSVAPGDPGG